MTDPILPSSAGTNEPLLKKLRFTRDVMKRARMDGKNCLMSIWEQDLEGVEEAIEILSCGAESNRHSGAVGAEKRAEQSNPGGGHEVTGDDFNHETVSDKPLPDEPTPAGGRHDVAQAVWMPIETAPRDGTDIIVYRPKFDGDYIPRVGTDYWMLKLLEPTWARSRKDCPPTHWMHFPEPPK